MTMDLPGHLAAGVSALRKGDTQAAISHLSEVAGSQALAAAPELADIQARACSLLAQACLADLQLERADQWARQALRLLRRLGDTAGQQAVRQLQDEIRAALAAPRSPSNAAATLLAHADLDTLLGRAPDAQSRAEILLKRAAAEIDRGEGATAIASVERAMAESEVESRARVHVLGHLLIARADPEQAEAAIRAALAAADEADDFNLVATAARAAQLAGVALPVLRSGGTGPG